MNVELLQKVKDYILAEPRRLNMENWLVPAEEVIDDEEDIPPCGTVACIAGNACIISGIAFKSGDVWHLPKDGPKLAQEALNLTHTEACRLFLVNEDWGDAPFHGRDGSWPKQFALPHECAQTPEERAKIAAERIDHFIKTNGAE